MRTGISEYSTQYLSHRSAVRWRNKLHQECVYQGFGCGGLTGWAEQSPTEFIFDLSYFIKAGCVERAVVSAGGPQIQCQFGGTVTKKRAPELEAGIAIPRGLNHTKFPPNWPPYTSEELKEIAKFYTKNHPTTAPHTGYVPMTWDATSTARQPTEAVPRMVRRGL